MQRILSIGALLIMAISAWQFGAHMDRESVQLAFAMIIGAMFGVPVTIIAICFAYTVKRVARLDVYHHSAKDTAQSPVFRLVDQREKLQASLHKRIEVKHG